MSAHVADTAEIERLLGADGDARLAPDPATGLDRYGCAPWPRAVIGFGSCTASTISAAGFAAAGRCLDALRAAAARRGWETARAAAAARLAAEILAHFGVADIADAVLTPSGSDAARIATGLLAAAAPDARWDTVLMAATETGSLVPEAARGAHPQATLRHIALREPDGRPRRPAAVTAATEAAVAAGGGRSIVHLIDGSKTGLTAPGLAAAARIQARHPGTEIVVDACQARLPAARLRRYLEQGWPVLVTGSKFYGGPPFSGAVLLPRARRLGSQGGEQSDTAPGVLCRWAAAVAEMHAYAALPDAEHRARRRRLAAALRAEFAADPRFEPLPPAAAAAEQSIFTFALRESATGDRFDLATLGRIHRQMNQDLGASLGPLARPACQIGQPVLAGAVPALRIAFGAREASVAELRACLAKLRLLADHVAALAA